MWVSFANGWFCPKLIQDVIHAIFSTLFSVETVNGTAVSGEDYIAFSDDVKFDKHEKLKACWIEIVDDNEWEPDEQFFVKLSVKKSDDGNHDRVTCGNISICTVTIVNDDG